MEEAEAVQEPARSGGLIRSAEPVHFFSPGGHPRKSGTCSLESSSPTQSRKIHPKAPCAASSFTILPRIALINGWRAANAGSVLAVVSAPKDLSHLSSHRTCSLGLHLRVPLGSRLVRRQPQCPPEPLSACEEARDDDRGDGDPDAERQAPMPGRPRPRPEALEEAAPTVLGEHPPVCATKEGHAHAPLTGGEDPLGFRRRHRWARAGGAISG